MTRKRTKAEPSILRSLSELANLLRLFLAVWEHWSSHILV